MAYNEKTFKDEKNSKDTVKGKKRSKNSKNYRRDNSGFNRANRSTKTASTSEMSTYNDISWYNRYPNLLTAAASFPFPYRPGMTLPFFDSNFLGQDKYKSAFNIPGVAILDWAPTIGKSETVTDPASVVAKEIYTRVRSAYSGSLEADPPDFLIYMMALDSIYAYIAWLKRVYRIVCAWSPDNYATPDVLLVAMGFSQVEIQDLLLNRSLMWQHINELVLMTRKFRCPATMDIMNRHYWMSDNVYTDAATINSQFYMFNPFAFYFYTTQNTPQGQPAGGLGMLTNPTYMMGNTRNVSVESLYQFGLKLIQALAGWDDAYTISGYLMRAFENDKQFIVDEIGPNEPFTPVYEPEVLTQIENSMTIPKGYTILPAYEESNWNNTIQNTVSQNPVNNTILCNPRAQIEVGSNDSYFESGITTCSPFINSRLDAPTADSNVIATRLKCGIGAVTKSTVNPIYTLELDVATEIPICWRFNNNSRAFWPTGSWLEQYLPAYAPNNSAVTSAQKMQSMLDLVSLAAFSSFDWKPFSHILFISTPDNTNQSVTGYTLSGDIHNITGLSLDELRNLHRVCLYSEFNSFSIA